MNALSLFSGIGGLDLAAEWAGFKTVAFCERDEFCQKVLRKHWPEVRIFDDVRTLDTSELPAIELLHGGYPCQPFSTAGNRRGEADERHMWPHMLRIVRELKPRWVVGENVKGHITLGLDTVCDDLEAEGYTVRAICIPACAVGAPHIRERVFVVANLRTWDTWKRVESIKKNVHRDEQWQQANMPSADSRSSVCAGNDGDWKIVRTNKAGWWEAEPAVGRVVYGVPTQPYRFKQLGNAVVPQQAYPIFAAIAETYNMELSGR